MLESVINEAPVQAVEHSGPVWLEAMPARLYQTPLYGNVDMTPKRLENFIKNFKENVRGQDIAIDFEHGEDPAKGKKAAGWYKDFKIAPSSDNPGVPALWAEVEFTEEAKKEVKDKQWRYFSLDWWDEWQDTDGNSFSDVIMGGALTNRPVAKKTMPINFSETMWKELDEDSKKVFADVIIDRLNEQKEWEHSEPGTGIPPEPRLDEESGVDDPAIEQGWRRFTPPDQDVPGSSSNSNTNTLKGGFVKVGEYVFAENQAQELLRVLELPVDAKPDSILEETRKLYGELSTLRANADKETQEKAFAEKYPEYWAEHNKLMERDRENSARNFSEDAKKVRRSVGNGLVDTQQGLSAAAQNKVIEMHKKFSEGTATIEDFEDCIKSITNGGIVTYGEIGSGRNEDEPPEINADTPAGVAQARRVFSEVVSRMMDEDKELTLEAAMQAAGKKHPDLAAAYRVNLPA